MKLAAVAALVALACPMAVAQNFPEIPDNYSPFSTPRKIELLQRMFDLGMLDHKTFAPSSPRVVIDADATCQSHLALVSLQLGLTPNFPDGYALRDWVWNLPLVEAFLAEVYGGREKLPTGIATTIASIRERAKRHDLDINDAAYQRFSDVPKGHWADEAIHRMRELGILKGYPDNTFRG
ncbi:MAG: S-layer homology domain-containing protein [Fimbriimonadaceae bacterium]